MGSFVRFLVAGLCSLAVLTGCASHRGAGTISPSGYAYNEAIAKTKSEQLLLNLVRLKYRDPIVFMDIDGITTQHQYVFSASAENLIPFRNTADGSSLIIPGASVSEVGGFHGLAAPPPSAVSSGIERLPSVAGHGVCGSVANGGYSVLSESLIFW